MGFGLVPTVCNVECACHCFRGLCTARAHTGTRCKQTPDKSLFSIKMGCGLPPAGHSWSSTLWGRVPRPGGRGMAGDPERAARAGWASRDAPPLPAPAHLDTAGSCLHNSRMSWVLRKSAQQGRQESSSTSTPRCRMTPTCFLLGLPKLWNTGVTPAPRLPSARRPGRGGVHWAALHHSPNPRPGLPLRGSAAQSDHSNRLQSSSPCPPVVPSTPMTPDGRGTAHPPPSLKHQRVRVSLGSEQQPGPPGAEPLLVVGLPRAAGPLCVPSAHRARGFKVKVRGLKVRGLSFIPELSRLATLAGGGSGP